MKNGRKELDERCHDMVKELDARLDAQQTVQAEIRNEDSLLTRGGTLASAARSVAFK